MTIIRVEEKDAVAADGSNTTISFDHGPKYSITFSNPFTKESEEDLAWYFEEHLTFPFTRKVRANKAAASITSYGEALFKQIFLSNSDVYADYRSLVKAGLSALSIEIAGTAQFHMLHWEALKDPNLALPLSLQAMIVRKNLRPQSQPSTLRPSPTINLLIVTARPSGQRDVGYRTISRPLVEALRSANLPVQIELLRPGTYRALENHLREVTAKHGEGYYHVVHFDVHGAVLSYEQFQQMLNKQYEASCYVYHARYGRSDIAPYEGFKGFLSFEDEYMENVADLTEASELANLLKSHSVPITILNACQSGKQVGDQETSLGSLLVQAGVQQVLAMTVSAAELFMRTLYTRLFAGDDLPVAILHARTELYNHRERRAYYGQRIDLDDWLLPVIYQNQSMRLSPRDFTLEERVAWFERKAVEEHYTPPDPTYSFVGRDLDILAIEKCVLTKRNILLIRSMLGAGKTTLLKHLGTWWHKTGFVKRIFFFDYDDKAWTLQQIMHAIAQDLYGSRYATDFQQLSPKAQEAMLAQTLRAEDHLLIFDNLESVARASSSIPNRPSKEEHILLRNFLLKLARGSTFVLIGSHGGLDWLATDTFHDNVHFLFGLDAEAISLLTDHILRKNHVNNYREDEDLQQVLKLLEGFPQAMEVVLANLGSHTPSEVLQNLKSGSIEMGQDHLEKSATSSINSSYRRLSPEAQQLLLCLAPFTSVINISPSASNHYIAQLRQQPALAAFPFDYWSRAIQEAQDVGLMCPDSTISPGFLRLQPLLPCFLRKYQSTAEQREVLQAVEKVFCEYYQQVGLQLNQLLTSQDMVAKQSGLSYVSMEFENLVTGLNLALLAQTSIAGYADVLLQFLITMHDLPRGLALCQHILVHFDQLSVDTIGDPLGFELANTLGFMSHWLFELKQYAMVEALCLGILQLIPQLAQLDEKRGNMLSAHAYLQLGMLKDEQRDFLVASHYYEQAMQIYKKFNDLHGQATLYHNMGVMAHSFRTPFIMPASITTWVWWHRSSSNYRRLSSITSMP